MSAPAENLDLEVREPATERERAAFPAVSRARLPELVAFAFERLHVSPATEISVAAVGEDEIAELHVQWMDLPGATDVMSFPMDELIPGTPEEPSEGTLGDIVLCPSVAADQARAAGHSTEDELCLLTVHGILHCLGYDHGTAEEEREMFGIQRGILEDFLDHPAPVETRH